ncbi:hypothetical protein ACQPZQ_28290 [Pseudonocardia sp. CA-142604]|uniref:linalool dehydratase/isomerase domain-containing protein n=1 Tax=Pseudonocardia sp. CA-142604 TaxID=3240024 RepID=UPI003D8A3237
MAGLLAFLFGGSAAVRAAGLSFIFPGAGIFYSLPPFPGWSWDLVWWLTQIPAGLLVVYASLQWGLRRILARGDYLALPAILASSAVVAAILAAVHAGHAGHTGHAMQTWTSVVAVVLAAGIPVALTGREWGRARAARARGDERAAVLASAAAAGAPPGPSGDTHTQPVPLPATPWALERPDAHTLADEQDRLRVAAWAETLALQPPGSWNGFGGFADEYLLPAMRYRIWALAVSLSFLHYSHTPAYAGYRQEAIKSLIIRYTDRQVWQYWMKENRWGMLSNNPDPIGTPKNIMFTGYLLLALSMYARATGDNETFNQPGALKFQWSPDTEFSYSHADIAQRVAANFEQSDMCLWDCEPGLTFPFCNSVALAGLQMWDSLMGSGRARTIAPVFLRRLREEFTAPDGDIITLQASRFGMSARAARGLTNTAQIAALLSPFDTGLEWRTWQLLVAEELESGRYRRPGPGSPTPTDADWGTGEGNKANALAWMMFLARQRGEDGWYRSLREAAGEFETPEALQPFGVSVHATGVLGLGMVGREDAWGAMVAGPAQPSVSGPRLAEAPHPDVAVATAVSRGKAHDTVLYPGRASGRYSLGFDRLTPGGRYIVSGAVNPSVTANVSGRATVEVDLTGRTLLRLRPV